MQGPKAGLIAWLQLRAAHKGWPCAAALAEHLRNDAAGSDHAASCVSDRIAATPCCMSVSASQGYLNPHLSMLDLSRRSAHAQRLASRIQIFRAHQVELVIQELLVVGTAVQLHWERVLRVEPSASNIQAALADGNALQPQNQLEA